MRKQYFFKLAKWTGIATIYYILWGYAICAAQEKSFAGESSSELPVILIIGAAILIGCVWGAVKRWRRRDLRGLDWIRAMRGR